MPKLVGDARRRRQLDLINLTPQLDRLARERDCLRGAIANAMRGHRRSFDRELAVRPLVERFNAVSTDWQMLRARVAALRQELRGD